MRISNKNKHLRGFTVLELLVAVSVTAILAGMLLNITSQVVKTQTQASGDLETSQIAHFILDRIQEDLHCAVYKNDGNVWMAASILEDKDNSGSWIETSMESLLLNHLELHQAIGLMGQTILLL